MADVSAGQAVFLMAASACLTYFGQRALGRAEAARAERRTLSAKRAGVHDEAYALVGAVAEASASVEMDVRRLEVGFATSREVEEACSGLHRQVDAATQFTWMMYRDGAPRLTVAFLDVLSSATALIQTLNTELEGDVWRFDLVAAAHEDLQDCVRKFRIGTRRAIGYHKISSGDRMRYVLRREWSRARRS
jgi:hypothetical protein